MSRERLLPAVLVAASLVAITWLGARAESAAPIADPEPGSLFASHHDGKRFFNPWQRSDKSALDFLRWRFSSNPWKEARRLRSEIRFVANDGGNLAGVEGSASITWVGHATLAVHDEGDVFLTDPHFGPRALLPKRLVPPGIPVESVPAHAFGVISHSHYDHLDAWSVEKLPATMGWYVPLGLGDWFRARGRSDVTELDWWQSAKRGRFTITCLPSQHWSRRIEHGIDETLWCTWLIDSGVRRYFFAGDTGYFHGFAEYGRRFGSIDVAMLPIGAYEPRWFMRDQHMNPAESYQAFRDLRASHMIGMHWGTFDLTDEPPDEAPRALAQVVREADGDASRTVVLGIGERWHVPENAREPIAPDAAR